MADEATHDVEKFCQLTREYWQEIFNGTSKAANAKCRALDKLVSKWTKEGIASASLRPLLTHQSNAIKLSAASYLTKFDDRDFAIAVLRDLALHDPSLIAASASAVLRIHKIPHILG